MESLDKLLPIVALTFALSMVSERLSNLLKLYLPGVLRFLRVFSRTLGLPMLQREVVIFCQKELWPAVRIFRHINDNLRFKKSVFVWENLHLKQADTELETIRERIILLLSLLSGWLIASLFCGEISAVLKKVDSDWKDNFLIAFGFGILFSFGSKFWHDMLDMLLFTKNVRRRWGDANLADIESAQQFANYLQTPDRNLVRQAIDQNAAWLKRDFAGIRAIAPGYDYLDGSYQHCAVVYLSGARPATFPSHLPLVGSILKVPIMVVDRLGPVQAHGYPGSQVLRQGGRHFGAFGCLVHKPNAPEQLFVLTCAHVVTGRKKNFDKTGLAALRFNAPPDDNLRVPENGFLFDGGYDCALIGPVAVNNHSNQSPGAVALKAPRQLSAQDQGAQVYAQVNSDPIGRHNGRIVDLVKDVQVEYDDGTMICYDMIMVESLSALYKFTERGDSGTVLYDPDGHALGLIVGGDASYSYALPMTDVLLQLSVQLPD